MVYEAIRELVRYGLEKGLITEDDAIYRRRSGEDPEGTS